VATGYGVEMYCLDRVRTGKYVSGRTALAQAIYRRLNTPRGTLRGGEEEEAYGIDLPGLVGEDDPLIIASLPGVIRGEILKDDRILDVDAEVIANEASNGEIDLVITVRVVAVDEDEAFSLTIGVSETSAELLSIDA
jgi:hypothetical protein